MVQVGDARTRSQMVEHLAQSRFTRELSLHYKGSKLAQP